MLERFLRDDIEAHQKDIDLLESEDSDAGGVEIQGYLPETVLSMNKLDSRSNINDGDSDVSMGGGQAPEDPSQDHQVS